MNLETELASLLKIFVEFHSVSGNSLQKQECVDWIESAFLRDILASLKRGGVEDCPYVLFAPEDMKLLWFAHVDVVPAPEALFSLRSENGKFFGRGVKDMKGSALPFLMAYRDVLRMGIRPPIGILITTDEETAGPTIPVLLETYDMQIPAAFTPDTGSSDGIVTEHKAVIWAELIAHGKSMHGAMPWKGANAVWLLQEALLSLRQAFPAPKTSEEWGMTVTPTSLKGSDTRNQTPSAAIAGLDIRYPADVAKTPKEVMLKLSQCLPDGCEIRELVSAPGLWTDAAHPMVQLIKGIAEEVTGTNVPIIREHGGTDARYFSERGIPAFLYGPIGGELHGEGEWVDAQSLLHQYEMYRKLFEALAK